MMYGPVFAAVRVEGDYRLAESLLKEHFREANVAQQFNKAARRKMAPELARIAEIVGDGTECFRMSPEAAREILLQLGEAVALPD
jgi:hypothetical protein